MPENTPPSSAAKRFPCPRCGQPSFWTGNPYRPFCSDRCKLIDLGAWATEDYRIPLKHGQDFEPSSASPPDEDA